jgi:hypothetical protein
MVLCELLPQMGIGQFDARGVFQRIKSGSFEDLFAEPVSVFDDPQCIHAHRRIELHPENRGSAREVPLLD